MAHRYDVNLFDKAVIADPYPMYEEVRATGKVVWNDTMKSWMVPGFAESTTVLTDDGQRFATAIDQETAFWFEAVNLMMVDGDVHHRLRAPVSAFFTRREVAKWEARINEVVDELLAPLVAGEEFDLIADFTMIPTIIVAEMMGVPRERHADFRSWSHDIVNNVFGHADPERRAVLQRAADELQAYFREEMARHRRDEPDDLLTDLIRLAEANGNSDEEVRSNAILLLAAGYDTTAKLMANCLVVLEQHPDQRRAVAEDPALVPAAIEEVLRWAGVSQATPRNVASDTVLADTELAAGDRLFVLHGAADRDPERWPDPLRFDVGRELKAHHGFGYGPHLCLGAPLARLESKVAVERLLRVAPEYALRDVVYGESLFSRGPDSGVVEVGAAVATR